MEKSIQKKKILHYPRLDTVLMVEEMVKKMGEYPTKKKLLEALPKRIMYQTFNLILKYLEDSGKIILDKGKIIWIYNPKLIKKSVKIK